MKKIDPTKHQLFRSISILSALIILLAASSLRAQCPGFPAGLEERDCALFPPLTTNATVFPTDTLSICAPNTNTVTYNNINLDGGVVRVCGNAVINGNFNSGIIVVQCGSSLTFNFGLLLNQNVMIVNYGNVIVNGNLNFQNVNNAFYNEGPSSRLIVTGNMSYAQNNGQNAYIKNEGYIGIGGNFRALDGGYTCLADGSKIVCNNLNYIQNCGGPSNRFIYAEASGSAIVRYSGTANIKANFTVFSNIQVYQAAGSAVNFFGCGSFGAATIVPNAPAVPDPGPSTAGCLENCFTGPLPIELGDFRAMQDYENIRLEWTTLREVNNDYFSIEKCGDGQDWGIIGQVQGAGNSSEKRNYSFSYAPDQDESHVFFRLKQVDFDGSFAYSEVVSVEILREGEIKVYPNPFSNELKITLSSSEASPVEVEIKTLTGQRVFANAFEGHDRIDLDGVASTLSPGAYFIVVRSGGQFITRKVIKTNRE